MKGRQGKFFTLMLIPHPQGEVRRIKISGFAFSLAILGIATSLMALFFFIEDYRRMKGEMVRLANLERINQVQKRQILSLAKKVKDFNQTLEKLRELEDKLRILAGMGTKLSEMEREKLGRGGPDAYLPFGEELSGEEEFSSPALIEKIEGNFAFLELQAQEHRKNFGELEKIIKTKRDLFASTPNIFPVHGWISSGFGWRRNPFTRKREFHPAIDIAAPWGTEVRGAAQGKVIFAGWKKFYGLTIKISHGYGYYTVYSHLSHILVKKGAWVGKGDIIGRVGSSGRSTAPHLHFEVWFRKKAINPLNLMVEPLGIG